MSGLYLSQERTVWFEKMSGIYQPLLTFPLIGFISIYQAFIIFGVGMPALFLTMSVSGKIYYGLVPFLILVVFSMIRPPVLSYEARLLAMVQFYARRGRHKSKKGRRPKSDDSVCLVRPIAPPKPARRRPPAGPQAEPTAPDIESMTIQVSPKDLMELSIILRDRDMDPYRRKKVRILIDDKLLINDRSTNSGEVTLTLNYDDCVGKRRITIVDSENEGNVIAERDVIFIREEF